VGALTTYPSQSLDDSNSGGLALAALLMVALGVVAAIGLRRSRSI
jgi:hypothetical protein